MKRIALLVLALCLLLTATAAAADVLIEPENAFYRTHRNDCVHEDMRAFVTSDAREVLSAPYGARLREVSPGDYLYFEWFYTASDGSVWGYLETWGQEGWVAMHGLQLVYDRLSFSAEHADEIVQNTENRPFKDWIEGDDAAIYAYPLGAYRYVMFGFSEEWSAPSEFYTDEQGRLWGYVGYQYGRIDGWVCLDDPLNEQLTERGEILVETNYPAPSEQGNGVNPLVWVIGSVVLVVAVSAVLLIVLLRKKKGTV